MKRIKSEYLMKRGRYLLTILLVAISFPYLANAQDTPEKGPTFRIFRYPNTSWEYDKEIGQSYPPIWEQGAIVDGAFHSFNITAPVNKYGNYGEAKGEYLDADVRIALFGSSFTAPSCSNLLQEKLEEALGKKVHVLNFSIGSTGILSMFDVAAVKVPRFEPDILLFTFNATAYLYPRIWRFNSPAEEHFWYFVQSLEEKDYLDPRVADIHSSTIITDLITEDWLQKMHKAKEAGDEETLRENPLVKELIDQYENLQRYIEVLDEIYGPVRIALKNEYNYHDDRRFVEEVEYVKKTGIPFYLIHVPTHPEVKTDNPGDYVFPPVGVPEEQGRRYVEQVEDIVGKPVIHLVDYFAPEYLEDTTGLFDHPTGGHPAPRGVEAMAEAFVKLLMERKDVEWSVDSDGRP